MLSVKNYFSELLVLFNNIDRKHLLQDPRGRKFVHHLLHCRNKNVKIEQHGYLSGGSWGEGGGRQSSYII